MGDFIVLCFLLVILGSFFGAGKKVAGLIVGGIVAVVAIVIQVVATFALWFVMLNVALTIAAIVAVIAWLFNRRNHRYGRRRWR